MTRINVVLIEDHTLVRKGIRSLLEEDYKIEVVGEAGDGREGIKKVRDLLPDVVVIDINLPLLNGLEVTRRLVKFFPGIKILILSMYDSEELIIETLEAGAKGYLLKKAVPHELVAAIYAVNDGRSYYSGSIDKILNERMIEYGSSKEEITRQCTLTAREREVTHLVAEGYSSREIAEILNVSIKTVENHRSNIMNKLKLNGLADLIKYAIGKGIIRLEY